MPLNDFIQKAKGLGLSKEQVMEFVQKKIDKVRQEGVIRGIDPDVIEEKIHEKLIPQPIEYNTDPADFVNNVVGDFAEPFKPVQKTGWEGEAMTPNEVVQASKPDTETTPFPDAVTIPEYSPIKEGAIAAAKTGVNMVLGSPRTASGLLTDYGIKAPLDIIGGAAQQTAEAGKQLAEKTIGQGTVTDLLNRFQKSTESGINQVKGVADTVQGLIYHNTPQFGGPEPIPEPQVGGSTEIMPMDTELRETPKEQAPDPSGYNKFSEAAKGLALMPYNAIYNTITAGRNAVYQLTGDEAYGPLPDQREILDQMAKDPDRAFADILAGIAPVFGVAAKVQARLADANAPIRVTPNNLAKFEQTASKPVREMTPFERLNAQVVLDNAISQNPDIIKNNPMLLQTWNELRTGVGPILESVQKSKALVESTLYDLYKNKVKETTEGMATAKTNKANVERGLYPEQPPTIEEKAAELGLTTKAEVQQMAKELYGRDLTREEAAMFRDNAADITRSKAAPTMDVPKEPTPVKTPGSLLRDIKTQRTMPFPEVQPEEAPPVLTEPKSEPALVRSPATLLEDAKKRRESPLIGMNGIGTVQNLYDRFMNPPPEKGQFVDETIKETPPPAKPMTFKELFKREMNKNTPKIGMFGAGTLQDLLFGTKPNDLSKAMGTANKEMYDAKSKGTELMNTIRDTAESQKPTNWDDFRTSFVSTFNPAIKRFKQAGLYDAPYSENKSQYSLDDLNYIQPVLQTFVQQTMKTIQDGLKGTGLNIANFDNFMDAENVLANRSKMKNPFPLDFYDRVLQEYTPEELATMRSVKDNFFNLWQKHVVDALEQAGSEGAYLANHIRNNRDYVTMKTQNLLDKDFAKHYGETSAKIYESEGMTGKNMPVIESTITKGMALITSAKITEAKRDFVDFMQQNFPQDVVLPNPNQEFAPPGYEALAYNHNGSPVKVYLPKDTVKMFSDIQQSSGGTLVGKFNNLFKNLWIDYSPVFKARNIIRDTWAATYQMPGLWNTIKHVWNMNPAMAALDPQNPWRSAFKVMFGMDDAQYNEMMRQGMLMPDTDYGDMNQPGVSGLERVSKRFKADMEGLRNKSAMSKLVSPLTKIANFATLYMFDPEVGKALENVNKMSAFKVLKDTGLHPKELAYMIRRIGSPAFMEKGNLFRTAGNPLLAVKDLVMFMNPAIQGFRADKYFFKKDPIGFTTKVIGTLALPSIALGMAMNGPNKELYDSIPDYDKFNYFNIIWGTDKDNNPLYFKLTMPQSFKPIHRMIMLAFGQSKEFATQFVKNLMDEMPNFSPAASIGFDMAKYAVSSEPPSDIMGRAVMPEDVWKAGNYDEDKKFTGRKAIGFGKYLFNQYGPGSLVRLNMDSKSTKTPKQIAADMLEPIGLEKYADDLAPLIGYANKAGISTTRVPLLGAFFQKGTQRAEKTINAAFADTEQEKAQKHLTQQDAVTKLLKGQKDLTQREKASLTPKVIENAILRTKFKNEPNDKVQFRLRLLQAKDDPILFKNLYLQGIKDGFIKAGGKK